MKWLKRRRERKVLRYIAAYGPCAEIELSPGTRPWLQDVLTDLVLDGDLETYIRAFGFTTGGERMYRLPKDK